MKKHKRRYVIAALWGLALFLFDSSCYAGNQLTNWSKSAAEIERALNHALSAYGDGKDDEATEMVADAYFGIFENEKANMEIAVRRFISFKVAVKIEKSFNKLRRAMHRKGSFKDIENRTAALIADVKKAARRLDEKGVVLNNDFNSR